MHNINLFGGLRLNRITIRRIRHLNQILLGSSIKYVTLFLANFDPTPCHTSQEPPKVRHTSRTLPPGFLVGLVQKSRTKAPCTNSLNCSLGFLSFVWKVLYGVVLSVPPSVRIHLLQQKVKHHFKFHVSYA